MNRAIQFGGLAMVLALSALACAAQDSRVFREGDTWVEEVTGSLAATRNLKLITDMGSVHINGGNQNGMSYVIRKRIHAYTEQQARRQFEQIRVSAGNQGEGAWIRAQGQNFGHGHNSAVDFNVQVPRNIALVVARTGGGALGIRNIAGRLEAETGGGGIQLDNIGDAIQAQSGGGNVEVGSVGGDLKIETGGGGIRIQSAGGVVEAQSGGGNVDIQSGRRGIQLETGGGSIHVGSCGGDLKVSTGGGAITIGDVNGQAELETGGGSIRLSSASGPVRAETGGGSVELYKMTHGAQAETGSGGIVAEFVGQGANFGNSSLETAAGDIRVFLPQDLPVTIEAAIDMGDGHQIHTDFSDLKVTTESGYGPRETYCQGKLNGGGRTLRIHTTTGNIELLRTASAGGRKPH